MIALGREDEIYMQIWLTQAQGIFSSQNGQSNLPTSLGQSGNQHLLSSDNSKEQHLDPQ